MATQISAFHTEKTLILPPLEIWPIRENIGLIFHVFDLGGEREVLEVGEVHISPKCTEPLYTLSDGQKVIVTERRGIERPDEADGVLFRQEGKKTEWLSHKKIEAFQKASSDGKGQKETLEAIKVSWNGAFNFKEEQKDDDGNVVTTGLRPPQIGGLHAIGAHWSLYKQAATVVMPTGTGKTETMLATLVAYSPGTILIVVPSKILRNQTANKFKTLGLLRLLGNLSPNARNPVVGIIMKQPRSEADLEILTKCHVVIATMSSLGEKKTLVLAKKIAKRVGTLIVDEAHHIGAKSWSHFREQFEDNKVLQFTATPYRRDGILVDGKVIYDYPLNVAQKENYFKKISFEPVYEIDEKAGDEAIAKAAIERLRKDTTGGLNHLIMARCSTIERAEEEILPIYQRLAPDLAPIIVHSEGEDVTSIVEQLRAGKSKIVVCVNMLGEGFDLPQLKIAAVHDTHKSLGVLMQFTGRFTRTAGEAIGEATVIANIADPQVSSALERLYSEDADWNHLLSEYSSEASKSHTALIEFLNSSERLDDSDREDSVEISHQLLRPKLSTVLYEAKTFTPKNFFKGLPKNVEVHRVWLHQESNTLYFVTRTKPTIQWTRSRELRDQLWNLFVLHFDQKQNLLFLGSSDKDSTHEKLAVAVGAEKSIYGDIIFRSLGRIKRLIFQNIGVKKHGRRNLSFALYTGTDVAQALSLTETGGSSIKSNLSGSGWEEGKLVTIGCSYKGRVWTREPGTIPEFVGWCEAVGRKIRDESIKTTEIMENVLIPEQVGALPDKNVLSIEWPNEILRNAEERVVLKKGGEEISLSMFDIKFVNLDAVANRLEFTVSLGEEQAWASFGLSIERGDFKIARLSNTLVKISIGALEVPLEEYFSNYPPLVQFVDLSELDGNLLIVPKDTTEMKFPQERFESWQWNGVDIQKESIWKGGAERHDSIQWKAAQQFINGGFDVVFDDDGAGEAADLVCLKEEENHIRLALVHCKFTRGTTPGSRVKDVMEVSSQAVRSAKWKWKFKDLCRHILTREKNLQGQGRSTRFLRGRNADLNNFIRMMRFKEIKPEILIVQPGLSMRRITSDQTAVLASAYSYLKETIGVDLDVICSD